MSFVLSNTFVQEVRAMSPLKPITIQATWFDDNGAGSRKREGWMLQLFVLHHIPYKGDLKISVPVTKEMTNEDVKRYINNQMLPWRKIARERV